ncbi:outer membrane protein [Tepidamorphus sp. 3E244]|uniref:outer membrane protein n=1 Tax=Tepidamorphus sp. 3E244 TaxID=3385498 RepID=UPI0038FC8C9F
MTKASKVQYAIALIAGLAATGTAGAADLLPPPPLPEPPTVHVGGGLYLRGYIGMTNQSVDSLENAQFATAEVTWLNEPGFDSSPLFGGGIGWVVNDWFRVDGTAEFRGRATFHGLDSYDTLPADGTPDGSNNYDGAKSEWLLLANAYFDLGTWHGITPYVGAGIGASRNTIHNFTDTNAPVGGEAYGATKSKWDLAWALHAGMGYQVTDRLTLDLAYRYVDMGDGVTGDLVAFDGTNAVDNPMHFKSLTSHDVMLGIRWNFDAPAPISDLPPPPAIFKH